MFSQWWHYLWATAIQPLAPSTKAVVCLPSPRLDPWKRVQTIVLMERVQAWNDIPCRLSSFVPHTVWVPCVITPHTTAPASLHRQWVEDSIVLWKCIQYVHPTNHWAVEQLAEAKLGRGRDTSVYAVRVSTLPAAPTIMKLLKQPNDLSHPFEREYLFEAWVMATVRHPNIAQCRAMAFQPDTGVPLILMQRYNGNLKTLVCDNPIDRLVLALRLLWDMGHALCFLHTHGILQRDIKPENILYKYTTTASGDAIAFSLCDFGFGVLVPPLEPDLQLLSAKRLHTSLDQDSSFVLGMAGSPMYMAPEVARAVNCIAMPARFAHGRVAADRDMLRSYPEGHAVQQVVTPMGFLPPSANHNDARDVGSFPPHDRDVGFLSSNVLTDHKDDDSDASTDELDSEPEENNSLHEYKRKRSSEKDNVNRSSPKRQRVEPASRASVTAADDSRFVMESEWERCNGMPCKVFGAPADIYSLGVTLVHFLTQDNESDIAIWSWRVLLDKWLTRHAHRFTPNDFLLVDTIQMLLRTMLNMDPYMRPTAHQVIVHLRSHSFLHSVTCPCASIPHHSRTCWNRDGRPSVVDLYTQSIDSTWVRHVPFVPWPRTERQQRQRRWSTRIDLCPPPMFAFLANDGLDAAETWEWVVPRTHPYAAFRETQRIELERVFCGAVYPWIYVLTIRVMDRLHPVWWVHWQNDVELFHCCVYATLRLLMTLLETTPANGAHWLEVLRPTAWGVTQKRWDNLSIHKLQRTLLMANRFALFSIPALLDVQFLSRAEKAWDQAGWFLQCKIK